MKKKITWGLMDSSPQNKPLKEVTHNGKILKKKVNASDFDGHFY
jgi:hypothetical protein